MCEICGRHPCHSQCPNSEYHKIGTCDKCGEDLYEDYIIWTDDDGNKFCSEECAEEFYGIKEIDY